MIPKVNFVWSFIYQEKLHLPETYEYERSEASKYVSGFIKKISPEWKNLEEDIFKYMSEITGLKWNREEIDCYLLKISKFTPFSSPLTIPLNFKINNRVFQLSNFIDTLIHEIIHNLFIQNKEDKVTDFFNYLINEKYSEENFTTAIHVPLHAIHREIFLKFFDKKRLKDHITLMAKFPDYKRSWDIVNKEGSKEIVEELKTRTS